jgi:hypothetical protein
MMLRFNELLKIGFIVFVTVLLVLMLIAIDRLGLA